VVGLHFRKAGNDHSQVGREAVIQVKHLSSDVIFKNCESVFIKVLRNVVKDSARLIYQIVVFVPYLTLFLLD
jgi:Na+-transporting NADH:ubiquinone oxidoreductase subunit NqrD